MKIINTTAPISIDNLKEFFVDKSIVFNIDYEASIIKGQKLITYLSNLDIPADLSISTEESFVEIIKEYLLAPSLVTIPLLEKSVIELLLAYKNNTLSDIERLIVTECEDEIKSWLKKLSSLTLYNMYIIQDETVQAWIESFPVNETDSMQGVNFISLLKHEELFELFQYIEESDLEFYPKYFQEYMFKGNNLFAYWANKDNPLFLLTWGVLTQENIASVEHIDAVKSALVELGESK